MANPPGNYDLQRALNSMNPVSRRIKLGDLLNTLITQTNAAAVQQDINTALASGSVAQASGTITVGGTATAGNTYTIQFVNAGTPSLVTPGVSIVGTVVTGSLNNTAAQIAAQINAQPVLFAAGVTASVASAVVTVRQPGVIGNGLTITATPVGAVTTTATSLTGGTGAVVARAAAAPIQALNTIA